MRETTWQLMLKGSLLFDHFMYDIFGYLEVIRKSGNMFLQSHIVSFISCIYNIIFYVILLLTQLSFI
jgi:hypothetical protein